MKCVYCDAPSATAVCQRCVGELTYESCCLCGATGETKEAFGLVFCPGCYEVFEKSVQLAIKAIKLGVEI